VGPDLHDRPCQPIPPQRRTASPAADDHITGRPASPMPAPHRRCHRDPKTAYLPAPAQTGLARTSKLGDCPSGPDGRKCRCLDPCLRSPGSGQDAGARRAHPCRAPAFLFPRPGCVWHPRPVLAITRRAGILVCRCGVVGFRACPPRVTGHAGVRVLPRSAGSGFACRHVPVPRCSGGAGGEMPGPWPAPTYPAEQVRHHDPFPLKGLRR